MRRKIPNIITLLRFFIAGLFIIFYASAELVLAAVSFFVAAVTDIIDGWLARKMNAISKWGALYDPLADKLLTSLAFIAFAFVGIVEIWMVIIIILRDVVTTFTRMLYFVDKKIPTSLTAKVKTFLQMAFIFTILVLQCTKRSEAIYSNITYYIMLVITLLNIWTMAEYVYQIYKQKKI